MDRFSVYYAGFSAGHRSGLTHGNELRAHGHDWRVEITVSGNEEQAIQESLDTLVSELRGRDLETVMAGGHPTGTGIALWLMEHLGASVDGIYRIEVECAGHHGYVTR